VGLGELDGLFNDVFDAADSGVADAADAAEVTRAALPTLESVA
jgi:hypothetical protein